jgi:hypothetical protein
VRPASLIHMTYATHLTYPTHLSRPIRR